MTRTMQPVIRVRRAAVSSTTDSPCTAREHNRADAQFVGHIELEGRTLVEMALTTDGNRRYVYVQHPQEEGVSIVEVTNPARPGLLATTFWPEGAELGQLTFFGDFAIGDALPRGPSLVSRRGFVVRNPSHLDEATLVLGLACVKRALVDGDGLVYFLSDTGLWIVETSLTKKPNVSLKKGWCVTPDTPSRNRKTRSLEDRMTRLEAQDHIARTGTTGAESRSKQRSSQSGGGI